MLINEQTIHVNVGSWVNALVFGALFVARIVVPHSGLMDQVIRCIVALAVGRRVMNRVWADRESSCEPVDASFAISVATFLLFFAVPEHWALNNEERLLMVSVLNAIALVAVVVFWITAPRVDSKQQFDIMQLFMAVAASVTGLVVRLLCDEVDFAAIQDPWSVTWLGGGLVVLFVARLKTELATRWAAIVHLALLVLSPLMMNVGFVWREWVDAAALGTMCIACAGEWNAQRRGL